MSGLDEMERRAREQAKRTKRTRKRKAQRRRAKERTRSPEQPVSHLRQLLARKNNHPLARWEP